MMKKILIVLVLALNYQSQAEPTQIIAAAFNPKNINEVYAIMDKPVDPAADLKNMLFFLDDLDQQTESRVDSEYPYLISIKFPASKHLLPDSIHYLNLGWRSSTQTGRFEKFIQSPPFRIFSIQSEAERILASQMPDGSIPLYYMKSDSVSQELVVIIPYFSHFAAKGLLIAYKTTKKKEFLDGAQRWIKWYADHMNPDGTVNDYKGIYPDLKSTGDMDSTDSYAAIYLVLLRDEEKISENSIFLKSMQNSVRKAVAAMELTKQSDSLTYAKPGFNMKYLMDSIEVREGYAAAADIATLLGWKKEKSEWMNSCNLITKQINEKFYSEEQKCFAYAIDEAGKALFDSQYYPGYMAQCFALTYILTSDSAKAKSLWKIICEEIFSEPKSFFASIDSFAVNAALVQHPEPFANVAWTLMQPNLPNAAFTFNSGHIIVLLNKFQDSNK